MAEAERCPICGRPAGKCDDRERAWYPTRIYCAASAAKAAADRMYDALHEKRPYHDGTFTSWAEKASDEHPFHYRDGIEIMALETDVNPGDLFTTERDATPWSVDHLEDG